MQTEPSLFVGLGKVQVIQEARIFNQSNASLRKCRLVLGKIAYLLNTGETFAPREATELFFSMTKLFQHKNVSRETRVKMANNGFRTN